MNKKLISLAVAAAVAAPAAAMAEATLYGTLGASLDYESVTNAITPVYQGDWVFSPGTLVIGEDANGDPVYNTEPTAQFGIRLDENGNAIEFVPGQDFDGWGFSQEGSALRGAGPSNRVGVKGSEDLGNGLKAIYQVELGVNFGAVDDNIESGRNGGVSIRNSFVGLAGSFGTFLMGRHDTPYKISTGKLDLFSDTMADYNGTVGFEDLRLDNSVLYISPSFSGLSFAGGISAPGGATAFGAQNVNSDQISSVYSLALIFNNGPFYASAAYESMNNELFNSTDTSNLGEAGCIDPVTSAELGTCNYVGDDYNKYRFGLGLLDWNGFTLTAIYEDQDNNPDGQRRTGVTFIDSDGFIVPGSVQNGVDKQQLWQVQAGYAFGNNMFKAMYGAVDRGDQQFAQATRDTISINNLRRDLSGDKSTWAVGFDHNFSKRTKAYILYTAVDDDADDAPLTSDASWDGFSIGMKHKF
ncbi:MAG: porin [Thiohalocapsa sp.]